MDDLGDAPRLIEGQGVHRIDEDGLHALLPGMVPAVIENRPQEALRLAGTRARGHDGGTPAVRRAGIEAPVRERRVGGAEAGGEEVPQCAGDLVGDDGEDHGAVAASAARCGGAMWHRLDWCGRAGSRRTGPTPLFDPSNSNQTREPM